MLHEWVHYAKQGYMWRGNASAYEREAWSRQIAFLERVQKKRGKRSKANLEDAINDAYGKRSEYGGKRRKIGGGGVQRY